MQAKPTAVNPRARPGNRNAAKPAGERSDAALNARVPAAVKRAWEAKARAEGHRSWAAYLIAHAPAH